MFAQYFHIVSGSKELIEFVICKQVEAIESLPLLLQIVGKSKFYLLDIIEHGGDFLIDILAVAGVVDWDDFFHVVD